MSNRGAVYSNVVKLGLNPELRVLLDDYIKNSLVIPIILFQTTNVEDAILLAVEYLKEKKEGTVEIPATSTQSWIKIVASRDSVGEVHINFVTMMHRHPTVEKRPYTGDPWEAGDIVLSNDILSTKCIGWACLYPGSPGAWERFGHTTRWYSQIEPLSDLPDPSEFQANRFVIHQVKDQLPYNVYYCTKVSEKRGWEWINLRIFDAELPGAIHDYLLKNPLIEEEVLKYFEDNPVRNTVDEYFEDNPVRNTVDEYFEDNPIRTTVDEYFKDNPVDEAKAVAAYFEQNPVRGTVNEYFKDNPVRGTVNEYFEDNPVRTTVDEYFKDNPVRGTINEYFEDNPVRGTVDEYLKDNPIKADEIVHQYLVDNPIDAEEAVSAYFESNPNEISSAVLGYLEDNPVSIEVNTTLLTSNWTSNGSHYNQTINNKAFASARNGIANLSESCTFSQISAARSAKMHISAQSSSSITISAYGAKPEVDIPITIVLFNI